MTRVALIDDHESVRLGLQTACDRAELTVAFSGARVHDYLTWRRDAGAAPVDVVVLDLALGDGSTVKGNVRTLICDGSRVLIHSVADRRRSVRDALAAGAAGVVSKTSPTDEVIIALRVVARGESLDNLEWASAVEGDTEFAAAQLATREREVLRLYAAGLPLKAVAERLGIAHSTAKENIARVRAKYVQAGRPAPTKVDLLRRAIEDGLVSSPDNALHE